MTTPRAVRILFGSHLWFTAHVHARIILILFALCVRPMKRDDTKKRQRRYAKSETPTTQPWDAWTQSEPWKPWPNIRDACEEVFGAECMADARRQQLQRIADDATKQQQQPQQNSSTNGRIGCCSCCGACNPEVLKLGAELVRLRAQLRAALMKAQIVKWEVID